MVASEEIAVQAILFLIVAVALYFAANWILERIEVRLGRRLEYRTLYFFALLLGLAMVSFSLIGRLSGP